MGKGHDFGKRHGNTPDDDNDDAVSPKRTKKEVFFPHTFTPPSSTPTRSPFYSLPDALFEELEVRHYMHFSPSQMTNLASSIEASLSSMHLKCVFALHGIAIAHFDTKLLSDTCTFIQESPFSHFYISVKWLVFAPKPHQILQGAIVHQSSEHLGLLLLNYFNASVTPSTTMYYNGGMWHHKDGQALFHGSNVEFQVQEVRGTPDGMLSITGSMDINGEAVVSGSEAVVKGKVQYGDVIVIRRTLLEGGVARKRLKKLKATSFLQANH